METTDLLPVKHCALCGTEFRSGRRDRKYCSDACKSEAGNIREREKRDTEKQQAEEARPSLPAFIETIQQILIKNREILDTCLNGLDIRRMEKRDLEGRGFNFKYITSQAPTLEDRGYCFCYELGYKEVDYERIVIVRREREVIC